MRILLMLVAALMLVTVAFTAPVQAQQRTTTTQQRPHRQPKAFSHQYKNQLNRAKRVRANRYARSRTVSPRFYSSNASARQSDRIRYRSRHAANRTRTRANVSPRRIQPRFYNTNAAKNFRGPRKNGVRTRRATLRNNTPTFWKN